ncbi:mitogen-activated protein kinase kinase kinase kinase 4-like isoform X2 [Macrobrachium nipponense]|uniref:mitogen-activated protein kinase kinase kinase kinase 4-like isoform X2 n=1 Tax=Macrobrachium nipponense TaxID=159736 RepID=UPI0030C7CB8E
MAWDVKKLPAPNLSVAQPTVGALRGAYSESNLYQGNMFGGLGEPRHYGSVPWLTDNSSTRFNAATNKYIHTTSSVFDDPRTRESIRVERGRATLEDLKKQVAEKEAAKRKEREEEERLFAAMNAPVAYNPSFQEDNPRRRNRGQGGNAKVDQAATVEDAGGGYYGDYGGGYGGGGGGGYDGLGGGGYNDYDYGGASQPEYTVPKFYGGRRPQRFNANMTSEERDMVNRDRQVQVEGELQWQIQMKKQLDAERKRKEELEERLMEESIKKQQEKMKMEYEAEMDRRRKKEEEQTRRRDAQLKHMEIIQSQLKDEKNSKMAKARAAAELAAATPPTDSRNDTREIKPAQKSGEAPKETPKTEPRRRVPKQDDDFGLNLKSDSRFLAARQPNKFFDSPMTPVKMARADDDRKRPKPMPEMPYTVTRQAAAGVLHGPPKYNSRSYQEGDYAPSKARANRPKTTLGKEHQTPELVTAPMTHDPDILIVAPDSAQSDGGRGRRSSPPPTAPSEVQAPRVDRVDIELQTTLEFDRWESERKRDESRPPVVRGTPFDWRVKIDGLSEEEKKKVQDETDDDIKQFQEQNGDLMSQLTALKSNLKPNDNSWNPGGTGQNKPDKGRTPQNNSRRETPSQNRNGGRAANDGYEPSFGGNTPTRNSNEGGPSGGQTQPKSQPKSVRQPQQLPQSPETIPSGKGGVDYMRITTPDESEESLPGTASQDEPEEHPFDPDDTDGTMIRKFLARTGKQR